MEVAAADPEWATGFEDECWWSRVALPTLSSWAQEGKLLRLLQRSVAKDDPEPKAISCYGLYLPQLDETWLRFVDGWPAPSLDRYGLLRDWHGGFDRVVAARRNIGMDSSAEGVGSRPGRRHLLVTLAYLELSSSRDMSVDFCNLMAC